MLLNQQTSDCEEAAKIVHTNTESLFRFKPMSCCLVYLNILTTSREHYVTITDRSAEAFLIHLLRYRII